MSAARVLVAFAFYVAALDLGWGMGFVGAVASLPGLVLLAAAGMLLGRAAVRAARTPAPRALTAARVLLRAGAALLLVGLPASLLMREATTLAVGEGEAVGAGAGIPGLRFAEVTLAPRGPHVLSKTVDVDALVSDDGGRPVRIGLFPPTRIGARRLSVVRFGYAPGFTLLGEGGAPIAGGHVKLGTLEQRGDDAALVRWTPETNVMMGAGTFPPRLEDLVSPRASDLHVFLRMVEARLGGAPRDLTDPDAYRWMLDGRPEQAVFLVQVFRGKEPVFEGRVPAGRAVRFPGGALALSPEVLLWVDLLATRDPWLPVVGIALALLAAGAALRGGVAAAGLVRPTPRA